jgi:hypothetical protein
MGQRSLEKPTKLDNCVTLLFEYIMASVPNPTVVAYFLCFVRKVVLWLIFVHMSILIASDLVDGFLLNLE